MSSITLREIAYNSPEYHEAIKLRYLVLRQPLNLTFTPADLANDEHDIHLAAINTTHTNADTDTTTSHTSSIVATLILHPTHPTLNTTTTQPQKQNHIKMRQVAVAPHVQGQGIGRQLVVWSEQVARERGCGVMVLHARVTAVGFYVSLGYRCVGEVFDEVNIPHQRMEKVLISA